MENDSSKPGAELDLNQSDQLEYLEKKSLDFALKSRSVATKSAYQSDWTIFCAWCNQNRLDTLPAKPSTVRCYITHMAEMGRATSTISRALTSIRQAHQISDLASPTIAMEVNETWKGIRRSGGIHQKRAKALSFVDLKKTIDNTRPTFIGRRDAALMLIAWAGALRRSEIVALDREDIEFVDEGMVLTIRKSKTDQEAEGYRIGIPFSNDEKYCPTRRLQHWIRLAQIISGPIFFKIGMQGRKFLCDVDRDKRLTSRMVNHILRRRLERCGINPRGYSAHSFRAGFCTHAAQKNVPEHIIQLHSRHKNSKILRKYIREGNLFVGNPLSVIF